MRGQKEKLYDHSIDRPHCYMAGTDCFGAVAGCRCVCVSCSEPKNQFESNKYKIFDENKILSEKS